METVNLIARAEIKINAPFEKVWDALINPAMIKKYMFGATVESEWKEGSKIIWKGEWEGKPYEDKGVILQLKPKHLLQYTHFSPLSGEEDKPENYHTVTIELTSEGNTTNVTLSQDHNHSEESMKHSEKNWKMMLEGLKKVMEANYSF